jgi:hypothetical protein
MPVIVTVSARNLKYAHRAEAVSTGETALPQKACGATRKQPRLLLYGGRQKCFARRRIFSDSHIPAGSAASGIYQTPWLSENAIKFSASGGNHNSRHKPSVFRSRASAISIQITGGGPCGKISFESCKLKTFRMCRLIQISGIAELYYNNRISGM